MSLRSVAFVPLLSHGQNQATARAPAERGSSIEEANAAGAGFFIAGSYPVQRKLSALCYLRMSICGALSFIERAERARAGSFRARYALGIPALHRFNQNASP
jgi:hypothetical protein